MPIHHALVFVLLMLPGTSLKDWQQHAGPNLQYVMQHGAIGLMSARTAEKDVITEGAQIRTIAAGARMAAANNVTLPYKADEYNLEASLANKNVELLNDSSPPMDNTGWPFTDSGESIFVLERIDRIPDADAAIGQWTREPRCCLMVLSTNPSPAAYAANDQLCPIAMYGSRLAHGFLTSPSTHTSGLVTNTDVAPTIADYFGAKLRTPAFGAPITVEALGGNLVATMDKRNDGYMSQASLIGYMPYVAGYLASLIGLFSWLILRRRANATVLAYVVLLAPTAMLLSGASGFEYGVLISVVAVSVGGRVLRSNVGFNVLAAVISAIAFVDAIVYQGHLTGSSMLGYTPSEGARYYGIGNEVMGLWIGAATYVCCKVAEMPKWRTWALVLAVAVIFALGLPGAGAKAGGFLVGLITLAAALWTRSGRVVRPGVAIIGGVGVLVAGVVALIVMGKLFGASHVTQTVAMAHSQGIGAIGSVIGRKAGMDAHLVFHSVWMIVLLVASVSTFVALRPIWRSPDLPRTEVVALITATAASFLLNDAGVVAAALCSLTLWCSAMLLLQRYRLAGDQRQIQAH